MSKIDFPRRRKHGSEAINWLLDYMEFRLELRRLDDTEKTNRLYTMHAIKKHGAATVRQMIDAAAESEFWRTRVTCMRTIYYKGVQILSSVVRGGIKRERIS